MTGLNLINNRFINNTAYTKGGAYFVFMNKNTEISNCIFADNTANNAGAIYNRGNMLMTNCNIINNHANENTGGLYNEVKYSKFYNSIFWNNYLGEEVNHIECKDLEEVEAFKLNFKNGVYINEAEESVSHVRNSRGGKIHMGTRTDR